MKRTKEARWACFCVAAAMFIALAATTVQAEDQSCAFFVSPRSVSIDKDDVQLKVIASSPTCSFSARSDVAWITVTPASMQGGGIVNLSATPPGEQRIGTVKIAGDEITVFQKGPVGVGAYTHDR